MPQGYSNIPQVVRERDDEIARLRARNDQLRAECVDLDRRLTYANNRIAELRIERDSLRDTVEEITGIPFVIPVEETADSPETRREIV